MFYRGLRGLGGRGSRPHEGIPNSFGQRPSFLLISRLFEALVFFLGGSIGLLKQPANKKT